VYRVFETLDALVTVVEEARGLPMTANCVVPRGDLLDLLDELRDAVPGELDDAQDVLDHRDELMASAERRADEVRGNAHEWSASVCRSTHQQSPVRLRSRHHACLDDPGVPGGRR